MDGYLPDAWGRKFPAELAHYTQGQRIAEHSPVVLSVFLPEIRIGGAARSIQFNRS
ncbi:MAG: hypothetical protein AAF662_06365 [Pseudomonadota bacterium]